MPSGIPIPFQYYGLTHGRAAARQGLAQAPKAEVLSVRLRRLREFRWRSPRAYAGYGAGVGWLWRQPLDRLRAGRTEQERRAVFRHYTHEPVLQGTLERPWDRLVAGLVLGSVAFARALQRKAAGNAREQPTLRMGSTHNMVRPFPQIQPRERTCYG